jgi:hypothetical protein
MSNEKDRERLVFRFRQGQREKFFGAARNLTDLSLVVASESALWCQSQRDLEDLVQTCQLILRQAEALHRLVGEMQWKENCAVSAMQDAANVQLREVAEAEVSE